jgi:hypothetical protein
MTTYMVFFSVWGLVTLALVVMVIYRSRLTRKESDWISLTEDAREDRAIETQTVIELKTKKLTFPIRALSAVSVVLLLVILTYWIYIGITTPPPAP